MRSELNIKNNKQHLYDDFLPLDNKMELKGLGFQHERNEASIIPIRKYHIYPNRSLGVYFL